MRMIRFCSFQMLEKTLRLLFDAGDHGIYSAIDAYIRYEFGRIVRNQITVDRFILAKEYRGRDGYAARCYVPAVAIAQLSEDCGSLEIRVYTMYPNITTIAVTSN